MKKKPTNYQPQNLTDEEMLQLGREKGEISKDERQSAAEDKWLKQVKNLHGRAFAATAGDNQSAVWDYAFGGIFTDARNYFVNRIRDLQEHRYAGNNFSVNNGIMEILAFDFNYGYHQYEWNGKSHNPDDDDAFEECDATDALDCNNLKIDVGVALTNLILCGGAIAKSIHSDTYQQWRSLLADLKYKYDFFDCGATKAQVTDFLAKLQSTARLLCLDLAFDDTQVKLSQNTERKARKRGKKQVRGGILGQLGL